LCAAPSREEVTVLLESRMQVASLLKLVRTTWPMSDDAGCANVFVHPVDVDERNRLVLPLTDGLPAQGLQRLGRRERIHLAHESSLLSLAIRGKFLDNLRFATAASAADPSEGFARQGNCDNTGAMRITAEAGQRFRGHTCDVVSVNVIGRIEAPIRGWRARPW
jgi:hypothetical protein